MTKEVRIYNGEKTVSSIVAPVKLDSYIKKNDIKTFSNIHKNKMD